MKEDGSFARPGPVEWPTLLLIAGCHAIWAGAVFGLARLSLPLAIAFTAPAITLHSSLQHEVLHGHPFGSRRLNEALVFLPLGLFYPYGRFRDTHLQHHIDERLTDPYDDPESNYLDPAVWARLPGWRRGLLRFNNRLFGRMLVGPAVGAADFITKDIHAILAGDRGIRRSWLMHGAGLVVLVLLLKRSPMPGWAYLLSAYLGLSILKIRTFLEHRAHALARGRTVIVEGGRVLPFLFLNNNLHVVHHCKPNVPWYRLPALYRADRARYLRRNEGYFYASYAEVFRRHFLRAKDPVPHPLWAKEP